MAGLRARPVNVPLDPPVQTASGWIEAAPLVLVDLLTEEGITGRSYIFCYTPVALAATAELVSRLEELIRGSAVAPVAIDARLQGAFRLLGPQGLTGIAMAAVDMAAGTRWPGLAVTPTSHWLEYLDVASAVLTEPVRVEDGHVAAPEVPGAGVEWDETAVRRFAL